MSKEEPDISSQPQTLLDKLRNESPWIVAAVTVPFILIGMMYGLGKLVENPSARQALDHMSDGVLFTLVGAAGFVFVLTRRLRWKETHASEVRAENATRRSIENPEQPKLAWEAGRATLEKYLDRNLGQIRTIATLTYVVLFCGFSLICFGVLQAFSDKSKLPVSIVASASGVLVSFIGGSFMVIYRSLLLQSKDYLWVLERINGVGMDVAVIESIPEESAQLKHATTAELAKTLLTLYGARTST